MELKEIIKGVDIKEFINYDSDKEIKGIEINSKSVIENSIFVAIKGTKFDGHNFVNASIENGASVIITQKRIKGIQECITQLVVEDSRKALAVCTANFYNNPQKEMKFIGVTGTNGKTSITYIMKHILSNLGYSIGLIGTSGCYINNQHFDTSLTTPDVLQLFPILNRMKQERCNIVIMEISAHAIDLQKVYGIDYDIGIITNISQDHLDYFKTIENYANTKFEFIKNQCKNKIINIDDENIMKLYRELEGNCITYGVRNPSDSFAVNIQEGICGIDFVYNSFDNIGQIHANLYGEHSVYNCLAILCAMKVLGIELDSVIPFFHTVPVIKGRFDMISVNNFHVVIDYAHTPDAIEKVSRTVRKFCSKKIIIIFGSSGYRDFTKRKIMGKVASQFCDRIIITSDNPRFEDPLDIAKDIASGCEHKNYQIIIDRAEAIKTALDEAREGDFILLCGKGDEIYMDIMAKDIPFSDYEEVNKYINQ